MHIINASIKEKGERGDQGEKKYFCQFQYTLQPHVSQFPKWAQWPPNSKRLPRHRRKREGRLRENHRKSHTMKKISNPKQILIFFFFLVNRWSNWAHTRWAASQTQNPRSADPRLPDSKSFFRHPKTFLGPIFEKLAQKLVSKCPKNGSKSKKQKSATTDQRP